MIRFGAFSVKSYNQPRRDQRQQVIEAARQTQMMVVPEGAVPQPTEFTMSLPPSRYVELDISAAGAEHYTFARPVSIVIDYSRCRGPLLPSGDLSVWYVEGQNKALVQDMGGVDDRLSRRVQFWTDHLSSYAIAY